MLPWVALFFSNCIVLLVGIFLVVQLNGLYVSENNPCRCRFKSVSIAGDESIPINKRGSGTKRLILLNFFRAGVERRQTEAQTSSVIYAIEEPETSQHSENQKRLIQALSELAKHANVQVIITTHSATIVRALAFNNIRLIRMLEGQKVIENVAPRQLPFLSLNEVNYLAFSEISEGYHNELYGYIEEMHWSCQDSRENSKITLMVSLRWNIQESQRMVA